MRPGETEDHAQRIGIREMSADIDSGLLAIGETREQFVTGLYQEILSRAPDEKGFRDHMRALEQGIPPHALVANFLNSSEFNAIYRRKILQNQSRSSSSKLKIYPINSLIFAFPEDDWMFQTIIDTGEWEPWVVRAAMSVVRPSSSFVDIGANIGVFSIHAAKRGANVVAIEVSSTNCKILLLNASLNNVSVDIRNAAVSDHRGVVLFTKYDSANKAIHHVQPTLVIDNFDKFDLSPSYLLDDLMPSNIDVVKIDIEGYEYRAISGSNSLWHHLPYVFAEYSPKYIKDHSGVEGACYLKLFVDRGYTFSVLDPDAITPYGNDIEAVNKVYEAHLARGITHLDLAMIPPGAPALSV